jgi:hypothetical protein
MEMLSGVLLALSVGALAKVVGLDRDRAFYPTLLAVIASYDALFAATVRPLGPVAQEAAVMCVFVALAVAGFRRNLWLVVAALLGHGGLDLAHDRLLSNPGVPAWWPMFCLAFDAAAAAWLALGLMPADRPGVRTELRLAETCEREGRPDAAFRHLERAHVLSQSSTVEHVRVHVRMLLWGLRRRDGREVLGQVVRVIGAASKTPFGLVPRGNTGGADVSPVKPMPVPADLAQLVAESPRRRLREVVAAALEVGAARRAAGPA